MEHKIIPLNSDPTYMKYSSSRSGVIDIINKIPYYEFYAQNLSEGKY